MSVQASRDLVSPVIHRFCCGPKTKIYKHVQNDWLIICWMVLVGSVFATVASVAAMVYYASLHNRRGIFDYATGYVSILCQEFGVSNIAMHCDCHEYCACLFVK